MLRVSLGFHQRSSLATFRRPSCRPTNNCTMLAFKRKAAEPAAQIATDAKKQRIGTPASNQYKDSTNEIKYGIVLRKFYPPEMVNERALAYTSGKIERPIEALERATKETASAREAVDKGKSVVHWFKCDTRLMDNHALALASTKARELGVPLICIYLVSPQDLEAHLTAPVRVDFILRNLQVLKEDLAALDIPLYVETIEKRRNLPKRLVELCKSWGTNHIYCNMEYEVDELRREAGLTRFCLNGGIAFNVVHDTCVVKPGTLKSGSGGQISVYSPWHRKWCAHLNQHPKNLDLFPIPERNPPSGRIEFADLFSSSIPAAPRSKFLTDEEKVRFRSMWPAGEHEAHDRLEKFISERIKKYHETRNLPAGNGTSTLSAHLAAGTLSARTVVRAAREAAPAKKLTDDRKQGHSMWIGEVAWRDFYKHVLCHWPYICMNKPFKPEYSNIEWEYDLDQFKAWTEGKTGFPIVDAAMRQAKQTGYMHNRTRMIVASFLAKDLLIDWRMGEKWFMEHLIDGDFASNNGGWGFSASCGVDPQVSLRFSFFVCRKFCEESHRLRKIRTRTPLFKLDAD
jgi:deoxyribodipyrimidine photo-lyase